MFARWDKMAKAFTRINREIVIAVRAGGTDPKTNPLLRRALQNAKAANMPKDKVENAIKRAAGKDQKDYESILYEGYGPHGIPMIIEAATDNPTRTVANVRMHFRDYGGNLGTSGSVAYMFEHMGVFRLAPEGLDLEDLELKLIDFGLEEMGESTNEKDEPQIVIRCRFNDFGKMQAAIEEMGLNTLSSEPAYVPQNRAELPDDKANEVLELVDALEQDDDVQRVFHNLA